jgi:hypothetical protein
LSREEFWPVPYWDTDTGFGVMLSLLTAVDLGLGAVFFGIFQGEGALMDALDVREGYAPIGAVALGHETAGERTKPALATGRRPDDEVVRWERWWPDARFARTVDVKRASVIGIVAAVAVADARRDRVLTSAVIDKGGH